MNILKVSKEEDGIKLLRFLERRTDAPRTSIFKWIRTGQVRVNGGRVKAELKVQYDDEIRVPPFAINNESSKKNELNYNDNVVTNNCSYSYRHLIEYEDEDIIIIDKPAGLAVQPGTNQSSSVSEMLKLAHATLSFAPAPAHRLDKDSSGILVIGKNHLSLRYLSSLFLANKEELQRDYYAWVVGDWKISKKAELTDYVAKMANRHGYEKIAVVDNNNSVGKEAKAIYECIKKIEVPMLGVCSLLKVRLLTGRKHQIRVQTSSRGYPIVGDTHYGATKHQTMLLHAYRIVIPNQKIAGDSITVEKKPNWQAPFGI